MAMIDLIKLLLHISLVAFLLSRHLLLVFSSFHVHFLLEKLFVLVFSCLELLEE